MRRVEDEMEGDEVGFKRRMRLGGGL